MVVDCGGGTVDITVHEVSNKEGHIKEVFKATGGSGTSGALGEQEPQRSPGCQVLAGSGALYLAHARSLHPGAGAGA